jgi:hypothetical protein
LAVPAEVGPMSIQHLLITNMNDQLELAENCRKSSPGAADK